MTSQDHDKCIKQTWGGAAAFGVILAILLMIFGVWFLKSVFIGALAFVVMGAILSALMCEEDPDRVDLDAYAAPKPDAAPATSAPAVPVEKVAAPQPAVAPDPVPEPAAVPPVAPTAPAAPIITAGEAIRPAALDAARGGAPDDLKKIKGVGPKLEQLLHSMGFYHYDQIAGWTDAEVAWVDENLEGFKGRVTRDQWVAQARVLAGGAA